MIQKKPPDPPGPPFDDTAFWEELLALWLQIACLIEREKLGRTVTNADLRKAGKRTLCNKVDKD